jgi:hypothetical protein
MAALAFALLSLLAAAAASPHSLAHSLTHPHPHPHSPTHSLTHSRRGLGAQSQAACPFDFKVFVYPLPLSAPALPAVSLAEQARRNSSFHVCVGCIYVSEAVM